MILTDARLWVRDAIRDGADTSTFSDDTIDRAIQQAGNKYCRETRSIVRTDSVAITAESTAFPVTTPLTLGFRPERIVDVWLTTEPDPLAIVSYENIQRKATVDAGAATPTHLAFLDDTSAGLLWRTPHEDLTARMRWWVPFTSWTPGGSGSTTLNIPDDLIMPVLKYGAAAMALEANKETRALAGMLMEQFDAHILQNMGAGSLGEKIIELDSMDTTAWRPLLGNR